MLTPQHLLPWVPVLFLLVGDPLQWTTGKDRIAVKDGDDPYVMKDDKLLISQNNRYEFSFGSIPGLEGRFVMVKRLPDKVIWKASIKNAPTSTLEVQSNGNVAVYNWFNGEKNWAWHTGTQGHKYDRERTEFVLQDDGNLCVYTQTFHHITRRVLTWQSGKDPEWR